MLKVEESCTPDIIFPSVVGFFSAAPEIFEQAPMNMLHTMYADVTVSQTRYKNGERTDDVRI